MAAHPCSPTDPRARGGRRPKFLWSVSPHAVNEAARRRAQSLSQLISNIRSLDMLKGTKRRGSLPLFGVTHGTRYALPSFGATRHVMSTKFIYLGSPMRGGTSPGPCPCLSPSPPPPAVGKEAHLQAKRELVAVARLWAPSSYCSVSPMLGSAIVSAITCSLSIKICNDIYNDGNNNAGCLWCLIGVYDLHFDLQTSPL